MATRTTIADAGHALASWRERHPGWADVFVSQDGMARDLTDIEEAEIQKAAG